MILIAFSEFFLHYVPNLYNKIYLKIKVLFDLNTRKFFILTFFLQVNNINNSMKLRFGSQNSLMREVTQLIW